MTTPHCIYINLDRSPARNQHMQDTFRALDIAASRVNAVDGRHLSDTEVAALNPQKKENRVLTKGEIACFLSHRKAWQSIVDSDHTHVVVFEDDVKLAPKAATLLADLSWVPSSADIIKIDTLPAGAMLSGPQKVGDTSFVLKKVHTKAVSTAGYIISRSCAQEFLNAPSEMRVPVDIAIFDPRHKILPRVSNMQLTPAIAVQQWAAANNPHMPQEAELSTLEQERKAARVGRSKLHPLGLARLKIELVRPAKQLSGLLERMSLRWKFGARWQQVRFIDDERL
ncbi:glycosyltransferase family 25 protein [Yoonia sp. I 8.24]|uniref:glycosyltransferase family 25 protein n=1 Tax=Yoonia sp. I 8.24 TaxID=1537229 RepID=UPI001EDEAF98|nr:glycosyltransferase family 25 protein [Yoonia sp. I 8.24]MCG3266640.1 glycosyltransferase family 25 protein [Yoonia sp. I 8.24]